SAGRCGARPIRPARWYMDRVRKGGKDDGMSELVRSRKRKTERMKSPTPGKRRPAGATWFLFHRPMRSARLRRRDLAERVLPRCNERRSRPEKSFVIRG